MQEAGKLYLVFEFVDKDLKKHMDHTLGTVDPQLTKVWKIPMISIDAFELQHMLLDLCRKPA
jgi:hypothetical protein